MDAITEEIMVKLVITRYPDGKKYIKPQAWFCGEKMQGPKKQQPKFSFGGVQDATTY